MKRLILLLTICLPVTLFGQAKKPISLDGGTIRSLNLTGSLNVADYVNVGNVVHAFTYFGDSTITFNFAEADTWYQVTNASNHLFNGSSELDNFTMSGDTLTFLKAGDYDMTAKLAIEGGNGFVYTLRFYNTTDSQPIPIASAVTGRGVGNITTFNVMAYFEGASVGDKIILQLRNADNTTAATIKNGVIKALLLHLD